MNKIKESCGGDAACQGRQRIDDALTEARRDIQRTSGSYFDPPSDGTARGLICCDADPERIEDETERPSS